MAKIKIETLTPVHIGSGRDLMKDLDFLFFKEEDNDGEKISVISVIEEKRVLEKIKKKNRRKLY